MLALDELGTVRVTEFSTTLAALGSDHQEDLGPTLGSDHSGIYDIIPRMAAPKRPYTLKIDHELLDALRVIKARDGISESEQIRRGIRLWLKAKGVRVDTPRLRSRGGSR